MSKAKISLGELIKSANNRLQELQYAPTTISNFMQYWRKLLDYANQRGEEYFSIELGESFLKEVCHIDVAVEKQTPGLPRWKVRPAKRAVYLLTDFQNSGSILRKWRAKSTPTPNCFLEIVEHFYAMCRSRYNGERTIQSKKFTVERFLVHLEQREVRSVAQMRETDISSFLCAMTAWSARTVATSVGNLRQFLSFLYQKKYTNNDFSKFLPTVPHGREGRLPNVWSQESVHKILDSIDRANPTGKRDYAILLMVIRLGLRDSDIQNLKFENLLWKECRIRLIQTKTKRALELPLSEEVGCAIIDYLKYGRPYGKKVIMKRSGANSPVNQGICPVFLYIKIKTILLSVIITGGGGCVMIDAKSMNFEELSAATRENLKSLGYGLRTIQMANSIWRDLEQFLGERCKRPFLPVFGLEYLHDRIDYPNCLEGKLTPGERDYIRAVRMLTSFQENGTIPSTLKRARSNWFEPINDIRSAYVHYCESVFRTRATKRSRIAAADRFMRIIMVNRGISVSELSPQIISGYVAGMAEYSKGTIEVHLRGLRCFFLFLFETGKTAQDLSESVPKLHGYMGEKIPHTLSTEQVNLILESIDRGSPIGKRNYAVLMMAACLGMRDSDITNLMFENIDWERSAISFFQKKTNKHLTLPLLPVVGEAIIDYLKNGRPKTDSKYIFVKHRPPFRQAVSFYSIMKIGLEDAGIKLDANVSKGLHILRHSLASELVRQGESYHTISTILGHASIGSTKAYTHIDVDGLFKCALELTEVTDCGR